MHYGEQFRSWGLGQTAKVAQSWMKIVQVPKISNTTILNTEDCGNKFCELFEKKKIQKKKFQKMLWTKVLPIKHGSCYVMLCSIYSILNVKRSITDRTLDIVVPE